MIVPACQAKLSSLGPVVKAIAANARAANPYTIHHCAGVGNHTTKEYFTSVSPIQASLSASTTNFSQLFYKT
jgi:hypothetical protein